jgi:hypothetical protein
VLGQIWNIGQVPSRNFNWLSFTPLPSGHLIWSFIIFCKDSLCCNRQAFGTPQKKRCESYCYLTTCYTSQPTSYCCNNFLLHIFCSYYNDYTSKQKGQNPVVILQAKSCDNLADLFTKSLPYSTFSKCVWYRYALT